MVPATLVEVTVYNQLGDRQLTVRTRRWCWWTTADMLKLHGVTGIPTGVCRAVPSIRATNFLTRLQPGQEIAPDAAKQEPHTHATHPFTVAYGLEIDDAAVAAKRAHLVANQVDRNVPPF
jgi:hypothetical protein